MAFFKKKSKSGNGNGRAPLAIVVDDASQNAIAFGVTWRAIATRNVGMAEAVKAARSAGATHLITSLQQFGFGAMPADAPAGVTVYAAARVAARQHGGDAIYALKLFEGEYWFAVVRGGQPSAMDRIIFSDNDLEITGEVVREIASGVDDGTKYTVYTNLEDHEFSDRARSLEPADLLLSVHSVEDTLVPLPSKRAQLPMPIVVAILVAIGIAFASKGWQMYQEKERQRLAALNVVVDEPPEQAWARAMKTWADTRTEPDARGLTAVRVSLGSVPLTWGGWKLQGGGCIAQTGVSPSQGGVQWNCSATYLRGPVGKVNRDMKDEVPAGWSVQYVGLDKINSSWSLRTPGKAFSFEALRPVEYHQVETASRLQKLQPSFGQIGDLAFAPVEIAPPRKADGTSYPVTDTTPQVRSAQFTLKAPLRSIDALIDAEIPAVWQQLAVTFQTDEGSKAGLRSSALMADVKGLIYAKP